MAVPFQDGLSQFFDDSGNPLAGGLIDTYAAGTTTRQATYTTAAGNVPHPNPVVLDAAGRASIFLGDGLAYRFDLKTAEGVLIDSVDNISGGGSAGSEFQSEIQTATDGQTVFNLADITYTPGTNSLKVYEDGVLLEPVVDYAETSTTRVTLTSGAAEGARFTFWAGADASNSTALDAANIAYTPAGATATNVEERLSRTVYVADYGTNTAAFQAAIDALPAAGGTIDGSGAAYTSIGTLSAGSKRIHWQNFLSINGLETSDVLPGNQTRVGPAIANGRGYMVSPDLIISAFSDANAILPALFLTKDSTVGVDGSGLAKIQWRGTSEEGQKNVDGGRMDSVIIDATRATFTARMNISPHVDGNDESQPTISFQDGVTIPAVDALVDITITSGGTGYTVGDSLTISSADGTGATALITKTSGGVVTRVSIQSNGYDFMDGEALTITGGTGAGLTATAIVPTNMFMYGHGTINAARKLLLNNTLVAEYDFVNERTQANLNIIEVQDKANPAAFSDALGTGIVNVGAAYYIQNVPTWQYSPTAGRIRQNRDFGHRTVAITSSDSPYAMDGLPELLLVNATSGNVNITLPAASLFGTGYSPRVVIRRTDSSGNTVTIQRDGSDTLNGGTSETLTGGKLYYSNGVAAWYSH